MTELPRDLKHKNRSSLKARERHDANQAVKHAKKWQRIRDREQPDELKGAPGGIRSGNVTRTKSRASLRSKGHR